MNALNWIISSSALIAAVFLIRAVFKKKLGAGVRYALWAIVLVRLLVPVSLFNSPVSIENAVSDTEISQDISAVSGISEIRHEADGSVTGTLSSGVKKPEEGQKPAPVTPQQQAPETPAETSHETVTRPAQTVVLQQATPERFERMQRTIKARDVLTVVYFTGLGLVAAYFVAANVRLYLKLRRSRTEIKTDAPVRVYSAEGLESSCFFLNSIYVAEENAGDPAKLRCVLAHELAHRRHGDVFIALLRCIAIAMHWYNPLVWAAAFASRRDSELFADSDAVRTIGEAERENYGRTLIELSRKPKVSANIAYAATTMTNGKAELKSRIKNIAQGRRTGLVIGCAVLAIVLAAAAIAFAGGTKAKAGTPDTTAAKQTEVPATKAPADPTSGPGSTEAPEEWFVNEAYALVEMLGMKYGFTVDRENAKLSEPQSDGSVVATFTSGSNGGDPISYVNVRFADEDGEWKIVQVTGMPARPRNNEYGMNYEDAVRGLWHWELNIPEEELRAAGCSMDGSIEDEKRLNEYAVGKALESFVNASNDNMFRCYGYRVIDVAKRYPDVPDDDAYFVKAAMDPVDLDWFANEYCESCSDGFCIGEEYPECRLFYVIMAESAVRGTGDGSYTAIVTIECSYDLYGPDDDEPDPIGPAWALAEKLGKVHGPLFDRTGAKVELNGSFAVVSFPCVTYPDEVLFVTVWKDADGSYIADPESVYVDLKEGTRDAFNERLDPDVISTKQEEFRNAVITVAADEIRASGCSAEIGSGEYKAAAAAIYGEKLAEYYRGSLTEDSPFCCYDVRCVGVETDADYEESYSVLIGFRARDILLFSYLFDYVPMYESGARHPGYEGWFVGWTLIEVRLEADGSLVLNAELNGAA